MTIKFDIARTLGAAGVLALLVPTAALAGDRVGTAFDLHPDHGRPGTGLDWRTNLSYAETTDAGPMPDARSDRRRA